MKKSPSHPGISKDEKGSRGTTLVDATAASCRRDAPTLCCSVTGAPAEATNVRAEAPCFYLDADKGNRTAGTPGSFSQGTLSVGLRNAVRCLRLRMWMEV